MLAALLLQQLRVSLGTTSTTASPRLASLMRWKRVEASFLRGKLHIVGVNDGARREIS